MTIIGCGLIGGSMALSWKKAGIIDEVIACDHRESNMQAALELGVADKAEVTDVGSTRCIVIEAAKKGLGGKFNQYAPCHPIAGGELPGVKYADADLFLGKKIISTPTDGMDPKYVKAMEDWWTKAGGIVQTMSPEEHDSIFAAVSHLPHVLAYTLVDMIAREPRAQDKLQMAGAGFRDFTRIASSSPRMWRDICLTNQPAISAELKRFRQALDEVQQVIDAKDGDRIEAIFENAMRNRRGLVFPPNPPKREPR
ncbi:MAG: prephenate dehydrogenase/arogenate dehydrogenase family protein [Burkholderiales bacterium]|nr:prephenate dehydrogenase/arogenate dehydrogenase family protein [Burkholderiales bacterium]